MTHPLANNPTETFIQHYAKHRNVRQAGLAVGLTHTEAVRLLNRKDVAGRIREIWGEAAEAAGVTPDMVFQQLRRFAFQDVRSLYDENGSLKPIGDLDDDTAACITGIDVETKFERDGKTEDGEQNYRPVNILKIRRVDPMPALTLFAKHGLFDLTVKARGDVAEKAVYSFERNPDGGQTYAQLLDTVQPVGEEELQRAREAARVAAQVGENAKIIASVLDAIGEGITKRTELIEAVHASTGESKQRVIHTLDAHTGSDFLAGARWQIVKGDKNAKVYHGLPLFSSFSGKEGVGSEKLKN